MMKQIMNRQAGIEPRLILEADNQQLGIGAGSMAKGRLGGVERIVAVVANAFPLNPSQAGVAVWENKAGIITGHYLGAGPNDLLLAKYMGIPSLTRYNRYC
jgi:hypothetical protein